MKEYRRTPNGTLAPKRAPLTGLGRHGPKVARSVKNGPSLVGDATCRIKDFSQQTLTCKGCGQIGHTVVLCEEEIASNELTLTCSNCTRTHTQSLEIWRSRALRVCYGSTRGAKCRGVTGPLGDHY